MSNRRCTHFIDTYMEYTFQSESPDSYHQWCAMSMVSSALGRKVWVDMGYFRVYPNMYIVLVGPPGKCRKSVAINTAIRLITDLEDVEISADAITREALIRALKTIQKQVEMNPGGSVSLDPTSDDDIYLHSSLTIVSKELSVFLGVGNHDLLSLLTDLYDNPDRWEYRTKNQGIDTIYNVWIGMLAASTPDWLVGSIPLTAIGGGYTSRVLFIVENNVRKKTPRPVLTEKEFTLMGDLKHDLEDITMMKGEMLLSDKAKDYFDSWYVHHSEHGIEDKRFWGYSERKHIHLLKVAMTLSAADNGDRLITDLHMKQALHMLDSIEDSMIDAFGAVGRSEDAMDIDTILEIIKVHGRLDRDRLIQLVWRDVPLRNIDLVLRTLLDMDEVDVFREDGKTFYQCKECSDDEQN